MPVPYHTTSVYDVSDEHISCAAFQAPDAKKCAQWLATEVAPRVYDQDTIDGFADDVAALAVEGFDNTALLEYVDAPPTKPGLHDIGESVADLFLIEKDGLLLPSNRRRDLRTPKGSLPGADIAGYSKTAHGNYQFAFGEIKTSTDAASPPSVMTHSDHGMVAQLIRLNNSLEIRRQLIYYLRSRRASTELTLAYSSSMESLAQGEYRLFGVLVRGVAPASSDVLKPVAKLRANISSDKKCSVYVLHADLAFDQWEIHCKAA